jgi:hypothetical protein
MMIKERMAFAGHHNNLLNRMNDGQGPFMQRDPEQKEALICTAGKSQGHKLSRLQNVSNPPLNDSINCRSKPTIPKRIINGEAHY